MKYKELIFKQITKIKEEKMCQYIECNTILYSFIDDVMSQVNYYDIDNEDRALAYDYMKLFYHSILSFISGYKKACVWNRDISTEDFFRFLDIVNELQILFTDIDKEIFKESLKD